MLCTLIRQHSNSRVETHGEVRAQLDSSQLWCICWVDTRSMAADGLTKGTVDRQALHDILNGIWQLNLPLKVRRSPMAARSDTA